MINLWDDVKISLFTDKEANQSTCPQSDRLTPS